MVEMVPIPGFAGYFVTKTGEIYSMRPLRRNCKPPIEPRRMKAMFMKKRGSYRFVMMQKDGKKTRQFISALVLSTFVSPRPEKMYACHGTLGNQVDSIDNLYWGTARQNQMDRLRDGTMKMGENHYHRLLNETQVRVIRRIREMNGTRAKNSSVAPSGYVSLKELGNIFGVSYRTISDISNGKSWKHLPYNEGK